MTTGDCVDLEALFGRICALDKCLGRVRAAQKDGTPVLANLNNATMENTNTTQAWTFCIFSKIKNLSENLKNLTKKLN